MTIEIVVLNAEQWNEICSSTLKYSFGYIWPMGKTRADFALIGQDATTKQPYGFVSIIELDADTAFMEHGGNFQSLISTPFTFRGYSMMVDYLKERYKYITTRILNSNITMLKMAMKVGFKITGTHRDHYGDLFVILDWNKV